VLSEENQAASRIAHHHTDATVLALQATKSITAHRGSTWFLLSRCEDRYKIEDCKQNHIFLKFFAEKGFFSGKILYFCTVYACMASVENERLCCLEVANKRRPKKLCII
jgi:hypothetical protein